ncbi:MAG TPA: cupin domain-containing protein, partial [Dehalococcoidia bacterium]|nr:cupin domain-containing protein [Dehalococcoidia bacterium]
TRWQDEALASEAEVVGRFEAEGLKPYSWSNGPGDTYQPHSHSYHKVLYCLRGSIIFRVLPAGVDYVLTPGDRLDLPAGTEHGAIVGREGVTCLEAASYSKN